LKSDSPLRDFAGEVALLIPDPGSWLEPSKNFLFGKRLLVFLPKPISPKNAASREQECSEDDSLSHGSSPPSMEQCHVDRDRSPLCLNSIRLRSTGRQTQRLRDGFDDVSGIVSTSLLMRLIYGFIDGLTGAVSSLANANCPLEIVLQELTNP